MDRMIIGIAGGTGSGKTTFTQRLKERFGTDVSVIYHDSYYKSHSDMPFEARTKLNYDHPDAFDTERMIQDIQALRRGETVLCPTYDYAIHDRSRKTLKVRSTKVIIVEGILIFEHKALRDLMDIKIFVDTDADVRILRRITRDVKERGRSLDSVVDQYLTTVKPMHEQFVEPSKRCADIVVLEGGHNLVALDMLIQRVKSHVEEDQSDLIPNYDKDSKDDPIYEGGLLNSYDLCQTTAVPIAEQMEVLTKLGFTVNDPESFLNRRVWMDRNYLEKHAFYAVLECMGRGRIDGPGKHGPSSCKRVYSMDMELWETEGVYAKFVREMVRISGGTLPITGIEEVYDPWDEEKGGYAVRLSLQYAGTPYTWETTVENDWFDWSLFGWLNGVLKREAAVQRLYAFYGAQSATVICTDKKTAEHITETTGICFYKA